MTPSTSTRAAPFTLALALLGALATGPAQACGGTEPHLASVCMTAANFCPRGYLPADGRLLEIRQSTALFALLGFTYGGNGQTTFALPDLRGRAPVSQGQGMGLLPVVLGQPFGADTVALTADQLPAHTHAATVAIRASTGSGNTDKPSGAVPASLPRSNLYSSGAPDAVMLANTVSVATAGRGQPIAVRSPALALQFCVAVEGVFPSRL